MENTTSNLPMDSQLPSNNFASNSRPGLNKNMLFLLLALVLVGGVGLIILNFSSDNQSVTLEPSEVLIDSQSGQPYSDAVLAVITEKTNLYSGSYQTSSEIADSELPDAELADTNALNYDKPRRATRSLILNPDNSATMTNLDNGGSNPETGSWSYDPNSKTIRLELTSNASGPLANTEILIFDTVSSDTLVAQSYDQIVYPDTDLVFYKI